MSLTFNITSIDGISIVSFEGKIITELDIEQLNTTISGSSRNIEVNLVFDFGKLTHINSSGINFIIRSLTRSRINNGDLVLCSILGNVKTLFEMAKVNEIFSIYTDVSEAINHFKQ
jgi:anti-anti-sigma factor